MQKIVTGIDIGTYHVKVVIAARPENPNEPPKILGTGYAESRGMKQGLYYFNTGGLALDRRGAQPGKQVRAGQSKARLCRDRRSRPRRGVLPRRDSGRARRLRSHCTRHSPRAHRGRKRAGADSAPQPPRAAYDSSALLDRRGARDGPAAPSASKASGSRPKCFLSPALSATSATS